MHDANSLDSVEVSLSPLERFEEFLQSRGKRITSQRKALIEHVFKKHEHFDADGLIEELARSEFRGQVSRPTIYRALNELVESGLLRRFELDGRSVYEHDYGYPAHDHLYCSECEKLIEFQSDELTELIKKISDGHQFRAGGHKLIVTGLCDECQKARRRVRRQVDMI